MTVGELIEILQDAPEDAQVLFAAQPSWPMEYTIRDVVRTDDDQIYLGEGSQLGYLPGEVSELLGWR